MRRFLYLILVSSLLLTLLNMPSSATRAATIIFVNSSTGNDTTGDGTAGNPYLSFNKAYTVAQSGDTINLTGTFDWTTTQESGDAVTSGYTLAKNLTIQGQTATTTIVQADDTPYTANRRVFTINGGVSVTFSQLTIRHGYLNADNIGGTAIHSSGGLTLLSTIITLNANPARFGGAALHINSSSPLIMRNTTVINNGNLSGYWQGYTGGLDLYGTSNTNEITNCTFYDNKAGYNGAIYANAPVTITNSTFLNNYGATSGGGIHAWGSARVYVRNNIFGNSTGYDLATGAGGLFIDGGYNIVETQSSAGFSNGVNGNIVGNQTNLNVDANVADNNSLYSTPTVALLTGSVAINAGEPTGSTHNSIAAPTEDQRGASRPDRTDIGSFEYGGLIDIAEPTVAASNLIGSSTSYNKTTLSWTNGDGSRRIVFLKNTGSGTASPADGTAYSANSTFGAGSQIGTSGWYAVYDGTGTTVDVTGLLSDRAYTLSICNCRSRWHRGRGHTEHRLSVCQLERR